MNRPYLENLRRRASRVLSADAERALALLGDNLWAEIDLNEIPSAHEDAFNAILTDIPWPKVKDEQGREVQLTLSNYSRFRQSPDRAVREGAVTAFLGHAAPVPARARRARSPASSSSTWPTPARAATTRRSPPTWTRTRSRRPSTTTSSPP